MPRGAGLAADRGPNTASPDAPAGRRRGTKTTHTKEYPAGVRYWDKGRAPREDVPQGTEPAIPDSGLAADRRSAELHGPQLDLDRSPVHDGGCGSLQHRHRLGGGGLRLDLRLLPPGRPDRPAPIVLQLDDHVVVVHPPVALRPQHGTLPDLPLPAGPPRVPDLPELQQDRHPVFPREERGQAAGIWDSGSKWASAIAPPLLTMLTLAFGWRAMFLIIGGAGIVIALAFWAFYRSPEHSRHLSDEEYRHILAGRDDTSENEPVTIPWMRFFTYPQTWGIMLGFFSTIWIWNIFLTFLPLFLQSTLGVSIENTGWAASVPYIAAALGAIFAGRVTLVLARKYAMTSMASKKTILVGGCVGLGILLCLVPFVHNLALALAVLSLALALVAAVQAQSWAISSDIVPDSHAARFGGIMNFGGYFGGALAPIVTGAVVDATGSYTPSFLVAGLIAVLGGLCYGFMVRKPIHSIA